MIGPALVEWLAADATIAGVVGDRIWRAGTVPEDDVLPRLTYQVVSSESIGNLDTISGLARVVVQINTASRDAQESIELMDAVRLRMQASSFRGVHAGIKVRGASKRTSGDIVQLPATAEEIGIFGVTTDFSIMYNEAVPA